MDGFTLVPSVMDVENLLISTHQQHSPLSTIIVVVFVGESVCVANFNPYCAKWSVEKLHLPVL